MARHPVSDVDVRLTSELRGLPEDARSNCADVQMTYA